MSGAKSFTSQFTSTIIKPISMCVLAAVTYWERWVRRSVWAASHHAWIQSPSCKVFFGQRLSFYPQNFTCFAQLGRRYGNVKYAFSNHGYTFTMMRSKCLVFPFNEKIATIAAGEMNSGNDWEAKKKGNKGCLYQPSAIESALSGSFPGGLKD